MTPRMNLVPPAFQRKLLVRKRIRQWFVPSAVALMASLTAVGEVGYRLRNLSLSAAALEERLRPMNEMSQDNDLIASRLKNLVGHESVLHEIVGVQRPVSLLAVISQSAGRTESRLQILKLTVQQTLAEKPVDRKPGGNAAATVARRDVTTEITITGVALDDAAVAAFVQSLKESQAFAAVELKSTVGTVIADVAARQYDVSCRR